MRHASLRWYLMPPVLSAQVIMCWLVLQRTSRSMRSLCCCCCQRCHLGAVGSEPAWGAAKTPRTPAPTPRNMGEHHDGMMMHSCAWLDLGPRVSLQTCTPAEWCAYFAGVTPPTRVHQGRRGPGGPREGVARRPPPHRPRPQGRTRVAPLPLGASATTGARPGATPPLPQASHMSTGELVPFL
jgi:hypothetical protein